MKFNNVPYWLLIALLLPALLINLGLLAFIDDEGIRATVAAEMAWRDNLIVPTLHGEFYYKKPPLWNWILLISFQLFGAADEWSARLPTIACLLAYTATIYAFCRPRLGKASAFLAAMLFFTCGRILFWDSILALIDICFSWVVFTLFMAVFYLGERDRWRTLFLLTYLLTAVAFMLKGLPALVFQAITLLTYFIYRKQFRRLFYLDHFLGIGLLALILGGYYLTYHQYNSLDNVFTTLFTESSQRTVVKFGIWRTVLHLFTFPFEMVYHFLPWSLLVLYFIRKGIVDYLRRDRFMVYCLLIFATNVIPYWTSPEVFPRYLLMLAPLLFIVFVYLNQWHQADRSWQYRALSGLLLFVCGAVALGWLAALVLPSAQLMPYYYLKLPLLALGTALFTWAAWRYTDRRWLMIVGVLLVFRVGFNWFVLPDRNRNDFGDQCRDTSIAVGQRFAGRPLYVYGESAMQPTNTFYLERAYGGVIPRRFSSFQPGDHYIIDPTRYPLPDAAPVDSFSVRHGKHTFYIIHLQQSDELPPLTRSETTAQPVE